MLPFSPCFDLKQFSLEERTVPRAEVSDNGVRVSDAHTGEVFRCWVKDGVFVSALVGMVGVVPAHLAEH